MEREQVVLKIDLSPRPYLPLSDEQVKKLVEWNPEVATIIFNNQAGWFGFYDEAIIMKSGYDDYVTEIFRSKK